MGPIDQQDRPTAQVESGNRGEAYTRPVSENQSGLPRIPAWLPKFAAGYLIYSLVVILWGAVVRAGRFGDGCGPNWPFCEGKGTAGFIEFAHRITSGMVLPLAIGAVYLGIKHFPKGSQARNATYGVLAFTITESLVGAWLVLKSYVTYDPSMARVGWMSVHLLNTFTLIGFMAALIWHFSGRPNIRLRLHREIALAVVLSVVGVALLGVSGAITALGDTIFPGKFGVQHSISEHILIRLRVWHPMIATSIGVMLMLFGQMIVQRRKDVPELKKWATAIIGIYAVQMLIGGASVLVSDPKAGIPIVMQVIHLFAADTLWLAVLGMSFLALQSNKEDVPTSAEAEAGDAGLMPAGMTRESTEPVPQATWKAYLALTKPRIISLLLFTTMVAMFIAKGGFPGWTLFWAVFIGGYAAAGAANAINMVIDSDIDLRMERTAKRPTVTHAISTKNAMLFAGALILLSVGLLAGFANWLSAMMAMSGLLFYVLIYTMGLKRRTPQNIVIGGAAGAFPPLVGYAAVTNHLGAFAWVLFAIIFVWTPVHFWALALLIKDDYAAAGIPMLPVVKGDRVTVFQIGVYTVLTALVSFIPLFQGEARSVYLVGSIVLNLFLIAFSAQLYKQPERPQALKVFKYSMIYLALLFVVIAVDRARWM